MVSHAVPSENNSWVQDPRDSHHSFRYIQEYTPLGVIRRIGAGNSSAVGLLADGTVLKYPLVKGEGTTALAVEKAIYDALGLHERIVRCLRVTADGLQLQFARHGSVAYHLSTKSPLPIAVRLRWCRQAAEAVAFIHSKGVIHCDLSTSNLLLGDGLDALLSDFQGTYQQFDGYAMENARYFLPRDVASAPNETTDIFALGTLMYTIMTGHEPYPELSDLEVEEQYRRLHFPSTDDIECGKVILRCWGQDYANTSEVVHDLASLD